MWFYALWTAKMPRTAVIIQEYPFQSNSFLSWLWAASRVCTSDIGYVAADQVSPVASRTSNIFWILRPWRMKKCCNDFICCICCTFSKWLYWLSKDMILCTSYEGIGYHIKFMRGYAILHSKGIKCTTVVIRCYGQVLNRISIIWYVLYYGQVMRGYKLLRTSWDDIIYFEGICCG